MHHIEPHYNWRDFYIASEDEKSPFFGTQYNEFSFTQKIYNYFIHPQWDNFGSNTLYLKVLFVDYPNEFAIIEFIGEWNDCINNDVMYLKRNIIDCLLKEGVHKFMLIGENVMNFHASDDCYYEEWQEELADEGGWITAINFRDHVIEEMKINNLHYHLNFNTHFNNINWRTAKPLQLFHNIEHLLMARSLK